MNLDWFSSPQHVVAGAVLGFVLALLLSRRLDQRWLLFTVAVGLTSIAEIVVEVIEYPLLYSVPARHAEYYRDTIVDLGVTLLGAIVGAALGVTSMRKRLRPPGAHRGRPTS